MAGIEYSPDHIYRYDQGTYGKGRLTGLTDPSGTTSYTWDQRGRLTTETRTISGLVSAVPQRAGAPVGAVHVLHVAAPQGDDERAKGARLDFFEGLLASKC
jgi:YD repeat-containing protein